MTAADLLRRLDAIADSTSATERALRDGEVDQAVDELIRLDGIVASTRLKLEAAGPPVLVVEFPYEGRARARMRGSEGDKERFLDWLASDDELTDLFDRVVELGRKRGA